MRSGGLKRTCLGGLASLALCAALLLGGAPESEATEEAIWGPSGTVAGGGSAFDTGGSESTRSGITSASPRRPRPSRRTPRSPDDPAYRWPAAIDQAVREGRRTGIQIALQVSRSPKWSNGGRSESRTGIAAFQPNIEDTSVGPRSDAKLLDASYGALKEASPRDIVIGGMTYTGGGGGETGPRQWLQRMRLPEPGWFPNGDSLDRFTPSVGVGSC